MPGVRFLLLIIFLFALAFCSKKSGEQPTLSVASLEEVFTAEGGSRKVAVASNSEWAGNSSQMWCMPTWTGNNGNGEITISVQPNTAATERSAIITVVSGSLQKELRVRQLGRASTDSIPPDQTGMRPLTAIELAKDMKLGWNLGNSLDAVGSETAWGNPVVSQRLIDSVKAAGFNAVRIPIAWSKFSDAAAYKIDTAWMGRVETVVNYVLRNGMYAVINIHWDGGWMQPTYASQVAVNNRLKTMWRQIAIRFRNYDDKLLFAGTNEVMKDGDYGTPTPEYYTVQNSYNQTFVTAVRATGGRNTYRHLVVQGFNTNIDHAVAFLKITADPTPQRLMVEVHYYDPYNFTLNENNNTITQWGKDATDPAKSESWAAEAYADRQFQKMKTVFIDKGYPVLLGEYGAIARLNLGSAAANAEHAAYRIYYTGYITRSAAAQGLIPFYWDNGFTGDKGMGIFNRNTGAKAFPEMVKAITGK
jgi:endoglucanase